MSIKENYQKIRREIPEDITIVLAAKTRNAKELLEAIDAGATDIGENYVQEAEKIQNKIGNRPVSIRWHLIGALQKNKIRKAIPIFDMIQTVGDYKIAESINKRVRDCGKEIIPVLIEINIGSEITKYGIKPEYGQIFDLVDKISRDLKHLRVEGLMTMGPRFEDPEKSRKYFRKTKEIFYKIKSLSLPGVYMNTLSMGMSNSYKVAIEEGSSMVRIGSAIFGKR
jgi:pyridoxal phosphate enzyme (YggS family)